jgi:NAD(P)-dependent dehydrogenase (short-subunit alcohol dehydrogenase family)
MRDFSGKVAVITGAADGIGRALAGAFAAAGARLVLADVDGPRVEAVGRELARLGTQVLTAPSDVSKQDQVLALRDAARARFGTVHVLCNNAGVGGGGPIRNQSLDDWKWIVDVNLWGVIYGIHSFLPILLANDDGGHVVNTASLAGLAVAPGLGPYCVTKFGVVALSETLDAELEAEGSAVGVSVLCPGFVRTNIFTSGRNRPARLGKQAKTPRPTADAQAAIEPLFIEPAQVADDVVDAIVHDKFWIFTHPQMLDSTAARHDRIMAAAEEARRRATP